MARIRSVHPGLTTDEAFMAMSAYAKAAWAPLWTECDDQGVFEWKPIVLKARILPADNVDFTALLAEWEQLGVVCRFEDEGKSYGAVRNFRKFQRPKKPQSKYPLPDSVRPYVGTQPASSASSSEPVPPKGELFPQMEDGGCNRRKKKINSGAKAPSRTTGKTIPPDWQPSESDTEWACKQGFPREFQDAQTEAMRLWAEANANRAIARKADWSKTWKGWCQREWQKWSRNGTGPPQQHRNGLADALDRAVEKAHRHDQGRDS